MVGDVPTIRADKPRRKDALRNRERLVEAAATAFRETGLGASVNAIAERAGVNVATLYRHFPTKDALILAVLETILEPLQAARDEALAEAGPDGVLRAFLRSAACKPTGNEGLIDALGRYPAGPRLRAELGDRAAAIVEPLVERAKRDGELREDVDARDLLFIMRGLAVVAGSPRGSAERLERHIDIVVRGLRP